jgi:hypothetical protein
MDRKTSCLALFVILGRVFRSFSVRLFRLMHLTDVSLVKAAVPKLLLGSGAEESFYCFLQQALKRGFLSSVECRMYQISSMIEVSSLTFRKESWTLEVIHYDKTYEYLRS